MRINDRGHVTKPMMKYRFFFSWLLLSCVLAPRAGAQVIPTAYPTGPGPSTITVGPGGRLVYNPEPNGDIIPDFSNAGYGGGGVLIPTVPVVTTLNPVSGDNKPQIQAAIDNLAKLAAGADGFRGAILLKAGVYPISSGLTIKNSGIVIRGEGQGTNGTVLQPTGSSGFTVFTIDNSSKWTTNTLHHMTDAYVPVGTRWFRVDSTQGMAAGDNVIVERPSPANWIHTIKMDQIPMRPGTGGTVQWSPGDYNLYFDRVIVAIEGDRIMVDAPLPESFEQQYGGGTISKYTFPNRLEKVGIEDLRVVSALTTHYTGISFKFNDVLNGWMRRITAENYAEHTLDVNGGKWQTFEDFTTLRPEPIPHPSAAPADFYFYGTHLSLFHRLNTTWGGHDYSTGSKGLGPNVYLECTANTYSEGGPHMRWTVGTLYDSIWYKGGGLNVRDAGYEGTGHGWQGANHVYWNIEASTINCQRPPTAHQWNAGGVTPSRTTVDPAKVAEWISFGTHIEPGSLYRAQLAERVGAAQALAVLGPPAGTNYYLLAAAPDTTQTVTAGRSVSLTATMLTAPNFSGTVTLNASGLPAGASAKFATATLSGAGESLVTISTAAITPPGNYTVTLTASGDFKDIKNGTQHLARRITIPLKVQERSGASGVWLRMD